MIVIYDRNDSGQYYKTTITIVIDDPNCHQLWSQVTLQIVASLMITIYDRNSFIIQATGYSVQDLLTNI